MEPASEALVALGRELQARHYRFIAITPSSHQRVLDREQVSATLESIFGWYRRFSQDMVDQTIPALLEKAGQLQNENGWLRSNVRFATIGNLLFVHSAFPTMSRDAVFFGPDTYRFARTLRLALAGLTIPEACTLIDIGCGSGAGGLFTAAQLLPPRANVILADVNKGESGWPMNKTLPKN